VELAKCGSNLRKLGRATLIHAKHGGTFVDEVLSGARTAAQLAVGALGAALTFRPRRFMSGVPISGVGKGVALEERVSELRSRPSGLRSGLSFFIFENTFVVSIANNRYKHTTNFLYPTNSIGYNIRHPKPVYSRHKKGFFSSAWKEHKERL
jgi:hypothetical protein